jgi:hypothetical protein
MHLGKVDQESINHPGFCPGLCSGECRSGEVWGVGPQQLSDATLCREPGGPGLSSLSRSWPRGGGTGSRARRLSQQPGGTLIAGAVTLHVTGEDTWVPGEKGFAQGLPQGRWLCRD